MPSSSAPAAPAAFALAALLPLLAAADCPGPVPPPEPFDCTIGLVTEESDFAPLADDGTTTAEMIFGFQGFLWIDVAIAGDADCPTVGDVSARVDIDGFDPLGRTISGVAFAAEGDGRISEVVQVRLDNAEGPSRYEGRSTTVTLKVTGEGAGGEGREAVCAGTLVLVDDDPCIHTDEDPYCDEGGDDDDSGEGT